MNRIVLLWGALFSLFLYSCSTDVSLQLNRFEETEYQKLGRLHNEGLDYVLDYIKQNKESLITKTGRSLSQDDYFSLMDRAVKEFLKSVPATATKSSPVDTCATFTEYNINDVLESFNDVEKNYYHKLDSILHSKENKDRILTSLTQLCEKIANDNNISHSSKEILLYSVEMGKSSLEYWMAKSQEWYVTLKGYESAETKAPWVEASGIVVDEYDRPKSGVTVCIVANQGHYGTVTDQNGHYGLGINPDDIVEIFTEGYKPIYIPANDYIAGPMTNHLEPIDVPGYVVEIVMSDISGLLGGLGGAVIGSAAVAIIVLHNDNII